MPFLAPGDLERAGLPADGLVLANPLAAEESVLRTSLLPGLLKAVAYNASHRAPGVGLYELGRVFGLGDGVVVDVDASALADRVLSGETEHLAVVLAGAEAPDAVRLVEVLLRSVHRWSLDAALLAPVVAEIATVDLHQVELAGLHPGRSAQILVGEDVVGQVGEVDPGVLEAYDIAERVAWLQLDLGVLLAIEPEVPTARAVSRYPSSDIDLAFVVDDEVTARDLHLAILSGAGRPDGLLPVEVELFDVVPLRTAGRGAQEPGVPHPVPGAGPHPHRRRGRGCPFGDHRRGRDVTRSDPPGLTLAAVADGRKTLQESA